MIKISHLAIDSTEPL